MKRYWSTTIYSYARTLILATLISGAASRAGADCDEAVKRLNTTHLGGTTLCELQDRYKAALDQLSRNGIQNPKHVGNAYATRFINMQDWTPYIAYFGDTEYAAWSVYKPLIKTWQNWANAAARIEDPKIKNIFVDGSIDDIQSWILNLHTIAMTGLLRPDQIGVFRKDVAEIIPLHYRNNAYTVDEIKSIANTPYKSFRTSQKLMNFEPRLCDDLPLKISKETINIEFKINEWDLSEPRKSCGDLTMTPPEEVREQMQRWASYVQKGLKELFANPSNVDIVAFAANVQQWMVVIHPFIDGNGRISRLMMDFVLRQFDLPPPTFQDMNRDFFTSQSEWADLVGKGMLNTVLALESCSRDGSALGCKVVSSAPPGN